MFVLPKNILLVLIVAALGAVILSGCSSQSGFSDELSTPQLDLQTVYPGIGDSDYPGIGDSDYQPADKGASSVDEDGNGQDEDHPGAGEKKNADAGNPDNDDNRNKDKDHPGAGEKKNADAGNPDNDDNRNKDKDHPGAGEKIID